MPTHPSTHSFFTDDLIWLTIGMFAFSFILSPTYLPTHPLTHPLNHPLTHPLITHSLTRSLSVLDCEIVVQARQLSAVCRLDVAYVHACRNAHYKPPASPCRNGKLSQK